MDTGCYRPCFLSYVYVYSPYFEYGCLATPGIDKFPSLYSKILRKIEKSLQAFLRKSTQNDTDSLRSVASHEHHIYKGQMWRP